MDIPNSIIEITENLSPGYHPLKNFKEWGVAVLNEKDNTTNLLDLITHMKYHPLTDEAFILLKGKATIIVSD